MNNVEEFKRFLDLEKIIIRRKIELIIEPKDNNDTFKSKLEYVKRTHPNIEFKIIQDVEIDKELSIDIFNYKKYLPMVI